MLFAIGLVVAVTAAVLGRKLHAARVNDKDFGWMSEQWLAEHRASRPELL